MHDDLPEGLKRVRFASTWNDPGGDIGLTTIGSTHPDGLNCIVGLAAGSKYKPAKRDATATVIVLEGEGFFNLGGEDIPYHRHSIFEVPSKTLHAFVVVRTDTLFVKQIRFGVERAKLVRDVVESLEARALGRIN